MEIKEKKVIISKKAQVSIWQIYEYLKQEVSLRTAQKVKKGILNKCKSLKDFSGYSKEEYLKELIGDYRSVTQWNYIIIYNLTDTEIQILNIIHASMHPDKRQNI